MADLVARAGQWLDARVGPLARHVPSWVVLVLLLVTSISLFVPLSPEMPRPSLDESWALGLNQAVAQGLVFGRDMIFTFGPYSFVFSKMYHPATDTLMLVSSGYLAVTYWLAIVLLVRDGRRYLPWLLLLVLAGFVIARDTLLLSYPLFVGLVCVRRPEPERPRYFVWLVAAMFASFGLLPLVKGSMLALCGLIVPIVAGQYALEKRWRLAAAVVVAPVISLAVWWLLIGQPLAGIPRHFRALMPIISGYAGAMGFPGETKEVLAFVVAAAVLLGAALLDRGTPRIPRLATVAIYGAFYFVAVKAGFVRHDAHALICSTALLVASVTFAGTMRSRLTPIVVAVALLGWFYIDRRHPTYQSDVLSQLEATFRAPVRGMQRRLGGAGLAHDYRETLASIREGAGFPALPGTTDSYSFGQTELIAAGATWNPRPILQSYSVYTAFLDAQNREHLLGPSAPDNILFRVEPIDLRLPPIEDGASWPLLLTRYTPDALVNGTLVLRKRAAPLSAEMTILKKVSRKLGKPVPVPPSDDLVFAQIDLRPNTVGKLASLIYKPSTLLVELTLEGGAKRIYRYPAEMGRLGFFVSPLIESTLELATVFGGAGYLSSKRVSSFVIRPEGGDWMWHSGFRVTFKTMPLPPVSDPRRFYTLDAPLESPATPLPLTACEGVIDEINGLRTPPGELGAMGILRIKGWLATSTKPARVPTATHVVLTATDGRVLVFATHKDPRPDVATHFNDPLLSGTGYATQIDITGLDGDYALSLGVRDGDHIARCDQFAYTLHIKPVLAPPIEGR